MGNTQNVNVISSETAKSAGITRASLKAVQDWHLGQIQRKTKRKEEGVLRHTMVYEELEKTISEMR